MILQNCDIKLDYNPATDILEVEYPDMHSYQLSEIRYSMDLMVNSIRNFDIKRLLFDSSKTLISVSDNEYVQVMDELVCLLAKTRLEKVARIAIQDKNREKVEHDKIIIQAQIFQLPFQLKTFNNRSEAKVWLIAHVN